MTAAPEPVLLDTPRGPARAFLHEPPGPAGALAVLLHGAGTDSTRSPLPAAADMLAAAGVLAVRLDQPYVVAGRRAPAPAAHLDEALLAVLPAFRAMVPGRPLGVLARSSGARVACRTAAACGTSAVAALGFPFRPPGRSGTAGGDRSDELRAGARACPMLVVQGDRDPFGHPGRTRGVRIRVIPAMGHTPTEAAALLAARWLARMLLSP